MEIGFFFWPYDVALVHMMAEAADAFGYDMVGIADTPGNAMDPWVATTLVAAGTRRARVAVCVTNLVTRHPAVSAAAIASVDRLAPGRAVLGIGVGHSGTRNLGAPSLPAGQLAEGVAFIKELLRGRPASYRGGAAHLPWVTRPSPVFLAASHPRSLRAAGATADGVFINYGLAADNVTESEGTVARAAREAGRTPGEVETWQIACLDCSEDGEASRRKIGAILAFVSAYVMGGGDLARRGVPPPYREPLLELRRRYSTRPGEADAALVARLGLFDYLSRRLAVCGTPEECLAQVRAARAAGVQRLMLTVSLAADPVGTVRLFGERVLPAVRRLRVASDTPTARADSR
ncbi:MAG: LLM class flavin-dependent oxidoreductase [Candidatus Rokuibacteriota bacterium]